MGNLLANFQPNIVGLNGFSIQVRPPATDRNHPNALGVDLRQMRTGKMAPSGCLITAADTILGGVGLTLTSSAWCFGLRLIGR